MTLTKLTLKSYLTHSASRECGSHVRKHILECLNTYAIVEIDFTDAVLTPSFADEAFGLLCHHLSYGEFNDKIKLVNLSLSQKALLTRVIAHRFSSSR